MVKSLPELKTVDWEVFLRNLLHMHNATRVDLSRSQTFPHVYRMNRKCSLRTRQQNYNIIIYDNIGQTTKLRWPLSADGC